MESQILYKELDIKLQLQVLEINCSITNHIESQVKFKKQEK